MQWYSPLKDLQTKNGIVLDFFPASEVCKFSCQYEARAGGGEIAQKLSKKKTDKIPAVNIITEQPFNHKKDIKIKKKQEKHLEISEPAASYLNMAINDFMTQTL